MYIVSSPNTLSHISMPPIKVAEFDPLVAQTVAEDRYRQHRSALKRVDELVSENGDGMEFSELGNKQILDTLVDSNHPDYPMKFLPQISMQFPNNDTYHRTMRWHCDRMGRETTVAVTFGSAPDLVEVLQGRLEVPQLDEDELVGGPEASLIAFLLSEEGQHAVSFAIEKGGLEPVNVHPGDINYMPSGIIHRRSPVLPSPLRVVVKGMC